MYGLRSAGRRTVTHNLRYCFNAIKICFQPIEYHDEPLGIEGPGRGFWMKNQGSAQTIQ